jgi:hypothetical protein
MTDLPNPDGMAVKLSQNPTPTAAEVSRAKVAAELRRRIELWSLNEYGAERWTAWRRARGLTDVDDVSCPYNEAIERLAQHLADASTFAWVANCGGALARTQASEIQTCLQRAWEVLRAAQRQSRP